jgi:hypothetical protein
VLSQLNENRGKAALVFKSDSNRKAEQIRANIQKVATRSEIPVVITTRGGDVYAVVPQTIRSRKGRK